MMPTGAPVAYNPALAWINAGSNVLGAMLGAPGGPEISGANPTVNSFQNNSGWTVATSGAKASSVPTVTSAAQSILSNPLVLIALVVGVAAWKHGL